MDDTNPMGYETTGSPAGAEPPRRLRSDRSHRFNGEEYA